MIGTRNDLVHVQGVRETPAESRAVVQCDTARLVQVDTDHPVVPDGSLLDVHQLVAMLFRKGFGELANFFPDFHFRSRADKKRSGRTCPTPAPQPTPRPRVRQAGEASASASLADRTHVERSADRARRRRRGGGWPLGTPPPPPPRLCRP